MLTIFRSMLILISLSTYIPRTKCSASFECLDADLLVLRDAFDPQR